MGKDKDDYDAKQVETTLQRRLNIEKNQIKKGKGDVKGVNTLWRILGGLRQDNRNEK